VEFTKQHIKTCVVACIVDADQRVLLTRRCIEPFCGDWVMPGGKIDHGEAILAALHREVREEVGIDIQVEGLIDVYEHLGVGERAEHFVILYYRVHPLSFDLQPNGQECTEARWVARDELAQLKLPPGTRHILGLIFPEMERRQRPRLIAPETEIPGLRPEDNL